MLAWRLAASAAAQPLSLRSIRACTTLNPRRFSSLALTTCLARPSLSLNMSDSAITPAESSAGPSNGASAASSAPPSPPSKRARLNQQGASRSSRRNMYTAAEREQHRLEKEKLREARQERENERRRLKAKMWNRKEQLEKFGEDPIWFDIVEMLGEEKVGELSKGEDEDRADANDEERRERSREAALHRQRYTRGDVVELTITRISSHGDGLAVNDEGDWVVVVPKTLPGERIKARVWVNERLYSKADLVETLGQDESLAFMEGINSKRREDVVGCKYFDVCSGCQYQMIPYEEQLKLKERVVRRAFHYYSGLKDLPPVQPTLASPLSYNYRTKITPHFALPRELKSLSSMRKRASRGKKGSEGLAEEIEGKKAELQDKDFLVNIGFDRLGGGSSGQGSILDIEECPIATRTINEALTGIRKTTKESIHSFKNGATLLLRDSLADFSGDETITVTEGKDTVKERVGETIFESPAGTFFQNNRSILPSLIDAVKRAILDLRDADADDATSERPSDVERRKHYLVDTYCGSGFFALCLADQFDEVAGVEISPESIRFAKRNAELNKRSNVSFLAGNAEDIFGTISYPSAQTTVIIDPPRRGCDEAFLKQLVRLAPASVVYVSCNVHTQARDVGNFIRASGGSYDVVSIGGLDMFPQTHHVEGLAVLRRRKEGKDGANGSTADEPPSKAEAQ